MRKSLKSSKPANLYLTNIDPFEINKTFTTFYNNLYNRDKNISTKTCWIIIGVNYSTYFRGLQNTSANRN